MFKILIILTYVSFYFGGSNAILYDCVTGKPATKAQLKTYKERNNLENCTVEVEPCDPNEWKRVDGSCNNLKRPSRGTHRTPTFKLLKAKFSEKYEPRKTEDCEDYPLSRELRTEFLPTGKVTELRVTQLFSYYVLFMVGDINSIHDIVNYVRNLTTCCTPKGKGDYRCTPVKVPVDDPVHRYSGISCMNLTRPQSYQTYRCLDNDTDFVRFEFQTPVFDLSNVYNLMPGFIDRLRTFKNGLLKVERDNGYLFPLADPESNYCILNQRPRETRCHMYNSNNVLGPNLMTILFYNHHNLIARGLRKLNPGWDDERLFYTARDINIAIAIQIFFYEMLPTVFGKSNMIRDGIITRDGGFRDLYDEKMPLQLTDEYHYVQRWFHTIQETTLKLYDKDGHFLKTFPLVNCTTRTGFFAVDDNMLNVIQGSFRQPSGAFDYIIDYDMADRVLGGILLSSDVATLDLEKGRYFGFQPYTKYREHFTKKTYNCFSDLKDSFHPENLYRLRQHYKKPGDIELLAGIWLEKHMKGGKVPQTMYDLMSDQLRRSIATDRHWYERSNRPHAFNPGQLQAIRKVTIAGVLCTIGNFVTEIQPRAFYTISHKNPLTKCTSSKIGKLDLTPWKEI